MIKTIQKNILLLLLTAITCNAQFYPKVAPENVWLPSENMPGVLTNKSTLKDALLWIDQNWPTNIPNEEVATKNKLQLLQLDLANTSETMRLEWKADVSNAVSNVNTRIDGILADWPYVFTYIKRSYASATTGIYINTDSGYFTNIPWSSESYSSTNLQSAWVGNDAAFVFPTTGMWMAQCEIVLQKYPVLATNDFTSWVVLEIFEDVTKVGITTIGATKISQTAAGVGYNGTVLIPVNAGVETKCRLAYSGCDVPFQIRTLSMAFYYLGR